VVELVIERREVKRVHITIVAAAAMRCAADHSVSFLNRALRIVAIFCKISRERTLKETNNRFLWLCNLLYNAIESDDY